MDYARKYLSDTQLNSDSPPSSRPVVAAADPPEAVEVESDFVIILAALLCALICVVGLIAVARCAWLRRGVSGGGAGGAHRTANKGLKKKVLNSLPKYTYKTDCKKVAAVKAEEVVAEVEDCAICLTEYADGDEIRVLPHCGHRFHVQCIDTWLGSHSSCPSCRRVLVESRCRKCGEYPAVGTAVAGGGGGGYTFVKPSQASSAAPSTSSPSSLV